MGKTVDKHELFKLLCENYIYATNEVGCLPSTYLSKQFETTPYQVKKTLKELINDGLVQSTCESYYSWFKERYYVIRGYCITKKATETDLYKTIDNEHNAYLQEMCSHIEELDEKAVHVVEVTNESV